MSDYSFMKTGFGGGASENKGEEISQLDILSLVSLFVENAMKTAGKHVEICNRDAITPQDIKYSLIYETRTWLKRKDLIENFNQMKKELEDEQNESDGEDDNEDYHDENREDELIVSDCMEFERKEIVDDENKEFLTNLYDYYDNWSDWQPQNVIENILKNAIDKTLTSI